MPLFVISSVYIIFPSEGAGLGAPRSPQGAASTQLVDGSFQNDRCHSLYRLNASKFCWNIGIDKR